MKKSLLALAVAGVALTSVASAATVYDKDGTTLSVYGRVQGVVYSSHTGATNNSGDDGLKATGRLGFDMRSQINSDLAALAKLEWDVADAYGNFRARYAWVGLDMGQYGLVKAGRFEDAVYTGVLSTTDIFDDWGCNAQVGNDDKRDGIIGYYWNGYGFDVQATVQLAHDNQHQDGAFLSYAKDQATGTVLADAETVNVNSAYSLAVGYTSAPVLFGPIAIKAGYGYTAYQLDHEGQTAAYYLDGTKDGKYKSKQSWATALSWGSLDQGLYLAALYNHTQFDIKELPGAPDVDYKLNGIEGVVGYGFANGVSVRTGYEWLEVQGQNSSLYGRTVPVYVNYQVNPNFNVWTEARFDASSSDDLGNISHGVYNYNQNVYSVGARYTF